jgi:hypothetical protein
MADLYQYFVYINSSELVRLTGNCKLISTVDIAQYKLILQIDPAITKQK